MLIEKREQRPYASHHQFYVEDGKDPGDTSDVEFWTGKTLTDKVAVVPGTVGIRTGTYGFIHVYSELHDSTPPLDMKDWDHITEASLEIKSDTLRVIGCLNVDSEEFAIKPGTYCVRCCHANLVGANDVDEGDDWYVVQIWPAPLSPPTVLKIWAGVE